MHKWLSMALAALAMTCFANPAHAGLLETYLEDGSNLLQDGSGEVFLRFDPNLQDYSFVNGGQIQQGDIVLSVFDITWVNSTSNTLDPTTEVTGVMAMEVVGITDVSGAFPFTTADLEFAALDPILASALLGVSSSAGDIAFFFEDPSNNLDISNDSTLAAIANATDGSLIMTASLTAPQDYLQGDDVVIDLEGYSPLTGVPGVSVRGSFEGGLSISHWNLSGDFVAAGMCPLGIFGDCYDMVLSGDYLVSDLAGFTVQDNAQFSFKREGPTTTVPAPAALGFLGLGLAGLGMSRRRRIA